MAQCAAVVRGDADASGCSGDEHHGRHGEECSEERDQRLDQDRAGQDAEDRRVCALMAGFRPLFAKHGSTTLGSKSVWFEYSTVCRVQYPPEESRAVVEVGGAYSRRSTPRRAAGGGLADLDVLLCADRLPIK